MLAGRGFKHDMTRLTSVRYCALVYLGVFGWLLSIPLMACARSFSCAVEIALESCNDVRSSTDLVNPERFVKLSFSSL